MKLKLKIEVKVKAREGRLIIKNKFFLPSLAQSRTN